MFEAQLLVSGSNGSATRLFSPWFPRLADNVRVTVEVLARDGGNLTVKLLDKSREETGNGIAKSGTLTINSVEARNKEWTGLKERVRYQFEVDGSGTGDWVVFRVLAPVWEDAANVS